MKPLSIGALLLCVLLCISCGDSKIEVQNPLLVIDTYPSNGSVISPNLSQIIVFFSAPVDENSISQNSFKFELVGSIDTEVEGTPVKTEILTLSDDRTSVFLSIDETPLSVGAVYRLAISNIRSKSGSSLPQNYYKFFTVGSK
jgi:hypothetical protein